MPLGSPEAELLLQRDRHRMLPAGTALLGPGVARHDGWTIGPEARSPGLLSVTVDAPCILSSHAATMSNDVSSRVTLLIKDNCFRPLLQD